jgi:hypothetical protein
MLANAKLSKIITLRNFRGKKKIFRTKKVSACNHLLQSWVIAKTTYNFALFDISDDFRRIFFDEFLAIWLTFCGIYALFKSRLNAVRHQHLFNTEGTNDYRRTTFTTDKEPRSGGIFYAISVVFSVRLLHYKNISPTSLSSCYFRI